MSQTNRPKVKIKTTRGTKIMTPVNVTTPTDEDSSNVQESDNSDISDVSADDSSSGNDPYVGEGSAAHPSSSVQETVSLSTVAKELRVTLSQPIDKHEFYQYLGINMDQYDIQMDQETATKYKRHIMSLKHGMHAAIPLQCYGGKKCPIGSKCPFTKTSSNGLPDYDRSTYPLFQNCPIEKDMIQLHMIDLAEEYQIGPEDYTDIAIISKLAALDVLEYRCNVSLATDQEGMVISEVSSIDFESGKEFLTRRIHPAFEIIEKIHRMRQDLIKSMVGTRREKYKAAAAIGDTAAKSQLTHNMQELLKLVEQNKQDEENIIDIEYSEKV